MDKIAINGWMFNAKKESYQFLKEKYRYPVNFPESLMEKAIDLNKAYSEGCYELAWKSDDAIKVIDFLAGYGFVILGGEAYLLKNDDLEFLGDNWYYEEKVIEDSVKKAKDYIQFYVSRNDEDNSYFSVTFKLLGI